MLRVDPERWRALSPLLDRALDLAAERRAAFLAELGREHPDLATHLGELLKEHDRLSGSSFLESSSVLDGAPVPSLAGQTLGPYTLEAPVGAGGMGTVWRARRSDGRFEAHVAIKLLNLALLDSGGEARVRREATLLARLAHPNIARLLDAGITATGQPYLVLEYVEGVRIDRYADERRLDPFERVRLFLQVADAVAHAHANLIVHRDLKPSNVLVGGDGRVKLLDFGVGKLLEAEVARDSTLTGGAALTPEYAAPEQARGDSATTATDVYGLGVLLYTLLTGRHPTNNTRQTPVDHLRALVDVDPAPASEAVRAPTPSDAVHRARLRQSTPERLRRIYRGDLDRVLSTALEKSPGRRYVSVSAFGDDLRRFIHHEPVSVERHAWGYRARKFVRRHRWPVAAAAAVFAALSIGLVAAERQRAVAERRFNELRRLAQQVFALDDRIQSLAGATEARQALVAASLQYLEGLAGDAGGDLDLLQDVSDGYWRVARIQGVPNALTLGDYAKAERSLQKAQDLADRILAVRPEDTRALERAAMVAHDRMILADSERRDADALVHARRVVDRLDRLLAAGSPASAQRGNVLLMLSNVSLAHVNQRQYDEGISYARRLLELAKRWEADARHVSFALSVIANARRLQGDLDAALQAIREAREVEKGSTYPDDTRRMIAQYPLLLREALILGEDRGISLNRPEEAAAILRHALDMHEAGARRDPHDTLSRTRVGTLGRELGDILRWYAPADALAVYETALARIAEIRNNVKARRDRALTLAGSSYALRALGRVAEARRRVQDALAILADTKDYPADRVSLDSEVCSVLQAEADQQAAERRVDEAARSYESLLAKVTAAAHNIGGDLRDAHALSLLYRDAARVHRTAGAADRATDLERRRAALWLQWSRTQPNNGFVRRQLAEAVR
jgi:serine/threonine protein kinase/tetratricopeptide (TPR) repeat protein